MDNTDNKALNLVKEFHKAFGHPINQLSQKPTKADIALRLRLMKEELGEIETALEEGDWVGVLDGLVDLDYVQKGTVLVFGFSQVYDQAFDEVHSSNMSKLGEDGKPIYREDGKILKGPNYFKPNLVRILKTVASMFKKQKTLELESRFDDRDE